jgi:hypothetical protein
MSGKALTIKFLIDNAQARAAHRQNIADFATTNRAATASANAQQRAGSQLDMIQARFAAADYRRRVKAQQDQVKLAQKAADQAAKAAQRAADQTARAADRAANAQQRAADRAAKAAQRAADQIAKAAQRAADKQLRDAQRAADAKLRADQRVADALDRLQTRYAANDYRRRVKAEQQAIMSAKRKAEAEKNAAEQAAVSQDRLLGKVTELAAGYLTIQGALSGYRLAVDLANQGKEAVAGHAEEVLRLNDALRESASIGGKGAPSLEDVKRFMDVRKASGLRTDEAQSYQNSALNSMGTVPLAKLPESERQGVLKEGAKVAARWGGGTAGAESWGNLSGQMANFIQKPGGGPVTSADVAPHLSKFADVLSYGKDSAQKMAENSSQVLSTLSQEGLMGSLVNPHEAAALTSIASASGSRSSYTETMQAVRGLSRFGDTSQKEGQTMSQAGFLKAATITEADNPRQKMEKAFAYIDKETKGGTTEAIPAFLQRHGWDNVEEAESLGRFYSGKKKGIFDEVMSAADKPVDQKQADAKNAEFRDSLAGRDRFADVEVDAAKIDQGQEEANLAIARKRGKAARIASGADQSTWENFKLWAKGKLQGGTENAQKIAEEQAGLAVRGEELGVTPQGESNGDLGVKALTGPLGGAVLNPLIHSATGVYQKRANQLEVDAKAQRMGLPGNGIGGPANAVEAFGARIGKNGLMGMGNELMGMMPKPSQALGFLTSMATGPAVSTLAGVGGAAAGTNGSANGKAGDDPNTALLSKAVNLLTQLVKGQPKRTAPTPRPVAKAAGQPRRP